MDDIQRRVYCEYLGRTQFNVFGEVYTAELDRAVYDEVSCKRKTGFYDIPVFTDVY